MKQEILMARLLRALAGKSQEAMGEEAGLQPSMVAQVELGKTSPSPKHLEALARGAGISVEDAAELVGLYESYRQTRREPGDHVEMALHQLSAQMLLHVEASLRRIQALHANTGLPAEERRKAEELWSRLEVCSPEGRLAIVRLGEEFRTWAFCERLCAESEREAPRQAALAADLARLAQEVAERVPGPDPWRNRLRGYATAHLAQALQAGGGLDAADALLAEAERLWQEGSDPAALLDPRRLPGFAAKPS
jgi:transcriptional regulator with XRE-family HTH domain